MSNAINLLSDATRATLEKARYTQERINIKNDHKAVTTSYENMSKVAAALGIDLTEAEYTFTVAKGEKGLAIYSPYVGNFNGEAAIFWGKVRKPLSEIALPIQVDPVGDKKPRPMLSIELPSDDDTVEFVLFTIMQPKDKQVDAKTLNSAYRKGKLVDYLAKPFEKPKKLIELAPGEYNVIGYKQFNFSGDIKYTIEVEGQGFFSANTRLARKLATSPVITPEQPATLLVEESTETTSTGHPIVPVDLTTVEDTLIPVFEF